MKQNPPLTWLSPKTKKTSSEKHGTGLFATQPIPSGETIAVKGGHIMTREKWAAIETSVGEAAEIQISDDLVIAPSAPEEFEGCMMALNHSCDPNLGVDGEISYVTTRDIKEGEELTLDYAMIDDYEGEMACLCGTASCRKVVTGKDWQKPELQKKYRGYFARFIEKKIQT